MQELSGEYKACYYELRLLFSKYETILVQVVPQISSLEVLAHHIGVILVMESIIHVEHQWVYDGGEDVHFYSDSFY